MERKKEYLISSVLFAIGAIIWIINIFINYHSKGVIDTLFLLQGCCALFFSAAAMIYFIQYRQSNRNKDD